MAVVKELDKTLFESYFKPKSTAITGIVRNGILDPQMDWYETPQPKGESILLATFHHTSCRITLAG